MHAVSAQALQDTTKKQADILGAVVETLLELADSLESVKGAFVGLASQVQEQQKCPWRQEVTQGIDIETLIANVSLLAKIAPLIDMNVRSELKERGYAVDSEGQPTPREGIFLFWDQLKAAVIRGAYSTLATAAITGGAFLVYNAKASGDRVKAQAEHEGIVALMAKDKEALALATQQKDAEIAKLRAQVGAKRK
jgi:hypothetical protein